MPYALLADFKAGLDVSRLPAAGGDGALVVLRNAHVTAGGEVERRQGYQLVYRLPASTFGLHGLDGKLYVFGSDVAPIGLPSIFIYQRLLAPDGLAMTAVLDTESFAGKVYVIAEFEGGAIHHFYDAIRVVDWDTVSMPVTSAHGILDYFESNLNRSGSTFNATEGLDGTTRIMTVQRDDGEPFVASAFRTLNGRPATVAEGASPGFAPIMAMVERRASARFYLRQGIVGTGGSVTRVAIKSGEGGWEIETLASPVNWSGGGSAADITEYLEAIRLAIQTGLDDPAYLVTRGTVTGFKPSRIQNAWIEIQAPPGAAFNDLELTVEATAAAGATTPAIDEGAMPILFAGGEGGNAEEGGKASAWTLRFPSIGDSEITETSIWTITLDSESLSIGRREPEMPRTCLAHRSKMYFGAKSILYFSGINEPANLLGGIGSGFINIANQAEGSRDITALGRYLGRMAIFSESSVQIWQIDEDELNNVPLQTLGNVGCIHPGSVVELGNVDTFFLTPSGVRSLRTRQGVDLASAIDVGTPIDDLAKAALAGAPPVRAAVEPATGRLWLAIGSTVFVLSSYPTRRITAWSTYELPAAISQFSPLSGGMYFRDATGDVYLFGGDALESSPTVLRTPFLSMGKPGHLKSDFAVALVATGEWAISLLTEPNAIATVQIGELEGTTVDHPRASAPGDAHLVALELSTTTAGAKLSQILLDFNARDWKS